MTIMMIDMTMTDMMIAGARANIAGIVTMTNAAIIAVTGAIIAANAAMAPAGRLSAVLRAQRLATGLRAGAAARRARFWVRSSVRLAAAPSTRQAVAAADPYSAEMAGS